MFSSVIFMATGQSPTQWKHMENLTISRGLGNRWRSLHWLSPRACGGAVNGSLRDFTDYTVLWGGLCAPSAQWPMADPPFDTEVFHFCHWKGGKEDEHNMESLRGPIFICYGWPNKVSQNEWQTTDAYCRTILGARSMKSGVSGALLPLKRLGRIYPRPVPSLC